MDIRQILNIFKRWAWLMIIGLIIASIGGYLFSARQTPIYQASTRFVIMRAAQTNIDYNSYLDSQQLISTYTELATTERLTQKASESLGYDVYRGQASAVQVGDTQFISLTVNDIDPNHAAEIANVLVDLLIAENEDLQAVRYITAEENLQNRINTVQTQIVSLQDQINSISETTVKEQLAQVESQIQDLQAQIIDLEARTSSYDQYTASQAQQQQYADDMFALTQLRPVLALYQEIYTNLVVMGEPINNGENTTSQLNQLQTTLNLYQQIYISSISSLENVRLMRAQNMPNVVQIEPAVAPMGPISPIPLRTAALAGAVGLLITAGIGFLIEYLDDTIKTPDDVKNALGLTVIGLVAEFQGNQKNGDKEQMSGMFVANQPRSPVSEGFRALRTNLEFSSIDQPLKTILVTSSGEGEGKTTVASNLAIILAQGGKNVMLVDADLRRPNVHRQFRIPNRVGLSDLVRGRINIMKATQTLEGIKRLNIIPSGSLPPDPAELLGSSKMTAIIEELKEKFDIVVIDSPPMLVSDAQIISSKIDGIIFVVRPGKTHTGAAISPLDELKRIEAKVLGVVLNRIPRNRSYFYGGYRYYSPHYTNNDYLHNVTIASSRRVRSEISQMEEAQETKTPSDVNDQIDKKV